MQHLVSIRYLLQHSLADAESRDRSSLLSKYKALSSDIQILKQRFEEEAEKKNDILRSLSKAQSDILLWKSKYENEALSQIKELEGNRSKIIARLSKSEETIDSLNQKISSTEKYKSKIQNELEDVSVV